MNQKRFADQNIRIDDFQHEVWVHCPNCQKQAVARVFEEYKTARLTCLHCAYGKELPTLFRSASFGVYQIKQGAHAYFQASLWFEAPFKGNQFWAYNPEHLDYLEKYIAATLREHKNREHFTLLEKLPRFYHEAKNRNGLLKIIVHLRNKVVDQ
jgi:Zn ribbon nucleic-acid-binding protein